MQDRGIVFDFDGVILDTETPLYESWEAMFARHGTHLEMETFARYIGGAEYFDFHALLERQTGLTLDRERLMEERRALYAERVSGNTVMPGVREYLSEARRRGYAIGLASNSDLGWVGSNLRELGLFDEFDVIRTRDHVVRGKPDPEIYLDATRALGVQPRHAIAVEDSASGVAAAKAAGLFAVAAPNPITIHQTLDAADLIVVSLEALPFAKLVELIVCRP